MEWVTIGGNASVLFLLPPNFATDIKVTLSVMDMAQVTQDNKSSTRSFTTKGRYTVEMECLCGNIQESTDIRMGLNRIKGELVVLPLWTDSVALTAQTNAGGTGVIFNHSNLPSRWGVWWVFVNLTTFVYELATVSSVGASTLVLGGGTTFTWPIGSILVPLILGRFSPAARPVFTKLTESVNTVKFTFEENSPLGFAINPVPTTLGTVQTNLGLGAAARLWNVPCTYAGAETDSAVVDIDYERIGFQRQDASFVYPQAPRRVTELAFDVCDRLTIGAIESCFIDRQGRAFNLWVPTFRSDVDLQEALPDATPTHITVDGTSRYLDTNFTTHPGYPYLCLNDNTGQAIWPFKIASIAGNVITTTVAIGQSWQQNAKISALILSRFQENTIQWTYHSDGYASTTIKWVEATEDYANSQYEEAVAQLYLFTNVTIAGTNFYPFTSFESSITVLGHTFLPGLFSHQEIKTGLDMGSDEATINSFQFSGNPLSLLLPWTLVGDLQCDIYEMNRVSLVTNQLFSGTVEELDTEGSKITAKIHGFGGLYNQQFHRHVMAANCPYAVYTPECGAIRVTAGGFINSWNASIAGVSGNNVTISISIFAGNQLANGIFSVGAQLIEIVANTSNLMVLARPPVGNVIGLACQVSAGCNGTLQDCVNKFNNLINFGGESNVPLTNPSVQAVKPRDSSVAKK